MWFCYAPNIPGCLVAFDSKLKVCFARQPRLPWQGNPCSCGRARAAAAGVVAESASRATEPASVVDKSAFPATESASTAAESIGLYHCRVVLPARRIGLRGCWFEDPGVESTSTARATVLGEASSVKETRRFDDWPCKQARQGEVSGVGEVSSGKGSKHAPHI